MKRLFILINLLFMSIFTIKAQDTTATKWKGKYFEYTTVGGSIGVLPLFATSPSQQSDMFSAKVDFLTKNQNGGYSDRNWTEFTTQFIEQVLKKHLTVDEIRKLLNPKTGHVMAKINFAFNYSGDILYTTFIFRKQVKHILTDEKLYAIYQDFMKMKVDTEGFLWWTKDGRPTPEEQKKIFGTGILPFFFKWNCP